MRAYRVLGLVIAGVFLLGGCSTKEVFEPKQIDGEWNRVESSGVEIVDKTADFALLDNDEVLSKENNTTKADIDTQKNYRLIGESGGYVLSSDIKGDLVLFDPRTKTTKTLELKKTVAAASTDGEVVAVVFASGKMALYSLATKEPLLTLEGATSVALDGRIVNPYFMNDLVLFLTLDGKVVIVNKKRKKRLRTIIVSADEYFNNVIYFDILKERLIVATAKKILSFGTTQKRVEYEARNITHDDSTLYVATKQGDIVALSPKLKEVAKVHFPFAHFLGLVIDGDKLYALEQEGYLISLTKDLLTYSVYEIDIPDESNVYSAKGRFYVGDKVVLVGDAVSK